MSVVVALADIEETILLCDSRASYADDTAKDALRKIFAATDHACLGYTSNDVQLTLNLITNVGKVLQRDKIVAAHDFLEKGPDIAREEYAKLTSERAKPAMSLVYAGMDFTLTQKVNINEHIAQMNGAPYEVPRRFGEALMRGEVDGCITLEPPTPVIFEQVFPTGEIRQRTNNGYVVSGSGSNVRKKLDDNRASLMSSTSDLGMKTFLVKHVLDKYIGSGAVGSIGGLVQAFRIRADGIVPFAYTNHRVSKVDGSEELVEEVAFDGKNWYRHDKVNNLTERIEILPLVAAKVD